MLCASVLVMSGCHAYTLDVDGTIAQRSAQPIDVQPSKDSNLLPLPKAVFGRPVAEGTLTQVEYQKEEGPADEATAQGKTMLQRLTPPKDLLGYDVPDIQLLPHNAPVKEKEAQIKKQFPPLPAIPKLAQAEMGPEDRPLTLSELQQLALRTNPLIRQALRDIDIARGSALQAKHYPNPTIGYEGSTLGQGNSNGQRSPGQQGGFFEQTIITMGKLTLAHEAAQRDVQIAEQRLKQAESDLQTQVRSRYFAVLSAKKNFESTKALAQLTDELYNVLLSQLIVGEVAAYEPMQIRVLAMQARGALVVAHNRYSTAWKQLAAALGTPAMPLTAVAGQIDMAVPQFEQDKVLAQVLSSHTDIISAQLGVEKTRLQSRLAEVQPFPDVTVHVAVQKDYTTPPFGTVANVNVGVPFPLWNRNQGNIRAAEAQWRRAQDDNDRIRNDLTSRVAEAFERYDNNRALLKMYQTQILPNQVQAFRAAVARHAAVGDKSVSYNDLVTSQQTLSTLITSYQGALSDQWNAVVDISGLLQTKDLFQAQPVEEVAPIPDIQEIFRPGLLHRHK
jgi:cobalt-zinc-cadmium efflux system outer membrane protein